MALTKWRDMGADDNERMDTSFNAPQDVRAIARPDGACALPGLGVIRAVGPESAAFLQGQLSHDMLRLDATRARLAAYCSPQGRMLASFVCVRASDDEIWLACSADLLAPTLRRLSMFVLRARTKLSDAGPALAAVGLCGASAAARLGAVAPRETWARAAFEGGSVVRLPDAGAPLDGVPRWLWLGEAAAAEALRAHLPAVAAEDWSRLEVLAGVAPVTAATSGRFVPQMLNYELVGGVDFRKGCYPGQEVVARSQYLGKLKRRTHLLEGPAALAAGQEVFWSEDPAQPAGLVAAAAPLGAGAVALVEMKNAAATRGTLHLGQADGPALARRALPYPLPADGGTEG